MVGLSSKKERVLKSKKEDIQDRDMLEKQERTGQDRIDAIEIRKNKSTSIGH